MSIRERAAKSAQSTAQSPRSKRAAGKYSIEAVERAIDILFAFKPSHPSLELRRIVEVTGLPKTTAFRLLETLVDRGLCEKKSDNSGYSLGYRLLQLADVRRRQTSLRDMAMPIMREIRDEIEETVVLSIRAGDHRFHLDSAEGLHQMRRMIEPGRQAPLYAGAAGKVILSGFPDDELEAYLERTPLAPLLKNTITNRAVLVRELKVIRTRGYGESHGEIVQGGGGALAAPVRDHSGATVAAIDILTAPGRNSAAHRERCIKLLLDGTRRLSERLGYRPAVGDSAA
jgi:IclR family KDG regulon transcriptional repressor